MNVSAEVVPASSEYTNNDRLTIILVRVFLILHIILFLWATSQMICAIFGFSINTLRSVSERCQSLPPLLFYNNQEDAMASLISAYFTIGVFTINLLLLIVSIALMIMEKELPTSDPLFPLGIQFVLLVIISFIYHFCAFLLFYFSLHEQLEKINEC
ncbi:hypothetical protein PRIPAC_84999 [Pristionchus pacificus]|uniref:Uncharacterized protein n=1 Tax=Pristionchus pacificus TaxID=54126 RepID=A0A2A6CIU3_PRIPA|nr:hypothetical protein PRIPAC_84999 [Pristionchus pacificus]|eukprot:PDM77973.1 hypothetical protein PRIPAC_35162 [Pristionchus pacificus]